MDTTTPLRVLLSEKGHTVFHTTRTATIHDCGVKMRELGIGALLVVDGSLLEGIISERDIVNKIVVCSCDPGKVRVAECMTTPVITVSPTTTVQEAMRIVTERRFRHLPVVEKGRLIGMISIGDLTRWIMLSQEREISALTDYIQGVK